MEKIKTRIYIFTLKNKLIWILYLASALSFGIGVFCSMTTSPHLAPVWWLISICILLLTILEHLGLVPRFI